MKERSDGAKVAERFLSVNRITSNLDFAGSAFDNLNSSDVILIHKGSIPLALVRRRTDKSGVGFFVKSSFQ